MPELIKVCSFELKDFLVFPGSEPPGATTIMPTVNLQTNVPVDSVVTSDILKDASKTVARILGKPESVKFLLGLVWLLQPVFFFMFVYIISCLLVFVFVFSLGGSVCKLRVPSSFLCFAVCDGNTQRRRTNVIWRK